MRLSVIIPVYKVEDSVVKCVESVLKQGVPGMEVILVDDGSPDNCPAICDALAAKDSRITVIHKVNGGLSDARNKGLDIARGEYLTFVDSDDWLLPDTYKPLMEWLASHEDCDMLEFSLKHIGGNRVEPLLRDATFATARQYWEGTMAWNHAYACNKIYKRWLFEGVRFPFGKAFEDIFTLPLLLAKSPRVATTRHGAYCYRWNENSVSTAASTAAEGLKQHLSALRMAAETMHTTPLSRHGWNIYYAMLCRQIDIYKLTKEIVLPWPMVRLVCWWHEKTKR